MTDYTAPPPTPQPSFPLTAPVRLTGRDKRDAIRPYPVVCIAADGTETVVTVIAPSKRTAVEAAHAAQQVRELAP